MNEYELYKTRHELKGTNSTDAIKNRTKTVFNGKFESSPSFYKVLVDGIETDAIVNQGKLSNFKSLMFRPDTSVNKGDIVTYENKDYLIIDFDTNKVYPTAKLELCNYSLEYATEGSTDYLKDENGEYVLDDDYRPIPITIEGEPISIPCIVRTSTYKLSDTEQILIPDNTLQVSMQYDTGKLFKINDVKSFWDDEYKVSFADMSQVDTVNGVGIVGYSFRNVSDGVVS